MYKNLLLLPGHRPWPTFVGFSYNDSFLTPCNDDAILICFILPALLAIAQTLLVTSATVKVPFWAP